MSQDRPIWLAVIVLAALMVAAGAGFITWLIAKNAGKAILAGASAFAGTVFLLMGMAYFLIGASSAPEVTPGTDVKIQDQDQASPTGSAPPSAG
ncbi:hypothetical protein AB0F73_04655 [Micromonospora purpureochromogenes]|uniref:hypothetical protein n=1 Tax=Micromonospora purpureochromogenes TaxID=47872 RepID=UPI00340976C8